MIRTRTGELPSLSGRDRLGPLGRAVIAAARRLRANHRPAAIPERQPRFEFEQVKRGGQQ